MNDGLGPVIVPTLDEGVRIQLELWQLEPSVRLELVEGTTTRWVDLYFRLSTQSIGFYLQDFPDVLYWARRRWAYHLTVLRSIPAIILKQDEDFTQHSGLSFTSYNRNFLNELD